MGKKYTPEELQRLFERLVPPGCSVSYKRSLKLRPAHAITTGRRKHKVLVPLIVDELSFAFAVHEVGHVLLGHFDKDDEVTDEYHAEMFTLSYMREVGAPVTRAVMAEVKQNVRDELDLWYRTSDTIAPPHVRKWCGWKKPPLQEHNG